MADQNYWKDRKAQLLNDILDSVDEKEISALYQKGSYYINDKVQGIFDRYRVKHDLSIKEAKELLNTLEDSTSYKKMLQKLQNGAKSTERKELLKKIEAPAYQARIKKLQDVQSEMDNLVSHIYNLEKNFNTLNYIDAAHDSYYKGMYSIQEGTDLFFQFNKLDDVLVDKLLKSKWSGANYSQRIWGNTQALANDVKEELLMGILTGKTERDMQATIAERFQVADYKARRLVQTESAFIANSIDQEVMKECGINRERFTAVHDLKTSKVCREHDGDMVEVGKGVPGTNIPPLHPNCRSFMQATFSDEVMKGLEERVRNPITGRNEVVKKTSYNEWLENLEQKHGHDTIDVLQKKVTNSSSDKKQYARYKDVIGDNGALKNLESFQDIKYKDVDKWKEIKQEYRIENKAKNLLTVAKEKELKITNDLSSTVKLHGGHLEGLDFRLKGQDSLVRKMITDVKEGAPLDVVSNTMYDLVRYTSVSEPESLTKHYFNVVDDLSKEGYNVVRVKNTLEDLESGYRGLNCVVKDSTGYKFELQFHTPESLKTKEINHKLYEEWRLDTTTAIRKTELEKTMKANVQSIETPKDINKIMNSNKIEG